MRFAFLFIGFSCTFFLQAQDKRVIVPEQFEVVEGKDTYQLNSITVFLLNKKGVNASFAVDAGSYKSCEATYADVIKGKSFLGTKLQLIIKDCKGNIVYESPEGYSKLKQYRQAYQAALRNIFKQIEPGTITLQTSIVDQPIAPIPPEAVKVLHQDTSVTQEVVVNEDKGRVPQTTFTSFKKETTNYVLKKVAKGFLWYKEDATTGSIEPLGTIEISEGSNFYLTTKDDLLIKGFFDAQGNIHVMEKENELIYRVVNQ